MGILRPIVQAFVLAVLHARQYLLLGRAIAAQLIGDQHTWDVLASLEQFPKELLGSLFVASALHQDIEHIAMLINCSPEIVQLAVDGEKDRLFGSCRGKHTFFDLVLARHKAMYKKRLMADVAEKQGELIHIFLMR
jgi:hypothetical protein